MPIDFNGVSYFYGKSTPFETKALENITTNIDCGRITAIVGETGSGKSTMIQMLNGLILPEQGTVTINNFVIQSKMKNIKELRKTVGIVFQFPEAQLFEETVEKDIIFGPLNFNVDLEHAKATAKDVIKLVGLDESFLQRSPFELSGGQKRRIAIAGILAMEPEIIILDEPTAGLDPMGAHLMMEMFADLNRLFNKTIIIVTHEMDHVLNYCDDVILMSKGVVVKKQDVYSFFNDTEFLENYQIELPLLLQFYHKLRTKKQFCEPDCLNLKNILHCVINGDHNE